MSVSLLDGPPDSQRRQWEQALRQRGDRYGAVASEAARRAKESFEQAGTQDLLELGAGQGRDTIFFASHGLNVCALDFAESGVKATRARAASLVLDERVQVAQHDVRESLPFPDESFDGCYSHMLYCMALTEAELRALTAEIRRVLKPGGLNVYTARTTGDPDYGKGNHHGERLYELDGFVVHFFDRDTVKRLAEGFDILSVEEFREGPLPRDLYLVTLRKSREP